MSIDVTAPRLPATPRFDWLKWTFRLVVLSMVIAALFPAIGCRGEDPKIVKARRDVLQLVMALKQYHTEYAALPTGDHARILATLRGDNPRKIVFFDCLPKSVNNHGELLDPWKTPYRIGASDLDHPWAYSFGKDQQDNGGAPGSDDIASW